LAAASLSLFSFANPALAGIVAGSSSNHFLGVTIADSDGGWWDVDMSGLLSYDDATGILSMPAPGSALGEGWSWDTENPPLEYRDASGATRTAVGVNWHTPERVNGDGTPWKSSFTFFAAGNVDPFMTYAFSAKNNTMLTQTFTFSYGEALIPSINGGYTVYADIVGGVSNPSGPNAGPSVKIDPVIADAAGDNDGVQEIQILRFSTDGGLTFVNAGVDVGQAFEHVGTGSAPYPLDSDTLGGTTAIAYNYWEITTQFTLSPSRDTAALSGFVEVLPDVVIPEPSTYALILGAAVGVVTFVRRSRRAAGSKAF
jgi:hypothetical protein